MTVYSQYSCCHTCKRSQFSAKHSLSQPGSPPRPHTAPEKPLSALSLLLQLNTAQIRLVLFLGFSGFFLRSLLDSRPLEAQHREPVCPLPRSHETGGQDHHPKKRHCFPQQRCSSGPLHMPTLIITLHFPPTLSCS